MLTIEFQTEEGGVTERCINAITSLWPGVTPEAIVQHVIEDLFEQALDNLDLLECVAEGAENQMRIQRQREEKLRREFAKARAARKFRPLHPLRAVSKAA